MSRPTTSNSDKEPDLSRNLTGERYDPDPRTALLAGADPRLNGRPRSRLRGRWPRFLLLVLLAISTLAGVGYWQWDRYRIRCAWDDAKQAITRRDLPAASIHLDRYVALRPEDPAGWFQAARNARRRGLFADSKRYLAECEKLGGNTDGIRLERDLLLVQQGVIGETDARLRATINPEHPDVRLVLEALARGYILNERWADARQACELWRAIEPDAPWAWLWGGWISERMVQIEQANDLYTRALELSPEDRDVRLAFARIQLRLRNAATSAPHYEWVLARHPEDHEALLGLAHCRIDEGRVPDAVLLIDRVLTREPNSNQALSLRGRAAMESGDPVGAERWLSRALQADPADAETLHLLVLSLRAQQKTKEAGEATRRLEALQQDQRRLTELMRMIGPQLDAAGPSYEAGVIALRIGRTQQGLNLLRDALRRKGDHRPTHAALAAYYRQSRQLDLAEVHQAHAERP